MADQATHWDQAGLNRDFARMLPRDHAQDPAAVQWVVTAAFYCAVHCIESHLATLGKHTGSHYQRGLALANPANGIPSDVDAAYQQLKSWSEAARYLARRFTLAYVQDNVLDTHLLEVTNFVGL